MLVHLAVLLFEVPDSGFEGTVVLFQDVDGHLELVVLLPENVLGRLPVDLVGT